MSDNTCSICLEPLLGGTPDPNSSNNETSVGAVIPCGHCFHMQCFGLWKASRTNRDCKCPNCNKHAQDCVRIFIAPPEGLSQGFGGNGSDDDDLSLSSNESEDQKLPAIETSQEVDGSDHDSTGSGTGSPIASSQDLFPNGQPLDTAILESDVDDHSDIVDLRTPRHAAAASSAAMLETSIVDLTESPPPRAKASNRHRKQQKSSKKKKKGSKPKEESEQRYKVTAKKYKRRFKQKDLQFRELCKLHQPMLIKHGELKGQLKELQEELEALEGQQGQQHIILNEKNMQLVTLEKDKKNLQSKLQKSEEECKSIKTDLQILRESYKKDLENARSDSMTEVKQLLKEHPKILQENQQLKRQIADYAIQLCDLRRQQRRRQEVGQFDSKYPATDMRRSPRKHASSPEVVHVKASKRRKQSDLAKDLRQMEVTRLATGPVTPLESSRNAFASGTRPRSLNTRLDEASGENSKEAAQKTVDTSQYSAVAHRMLMANKKQQERLQSKRAKKQKSRSILAALNNSTNQQRSLSQTEESEASPLTMRLKISSAKKRPPRFL